MSNLPHFTVHGGINLKCCELFFIVNDKQFLHLNYNSSRTIHDFFPERRSKCYNDYFLILIQYPAYQIIQSLKNKMIHEEKIERKLKDITNTILQHYTFRLV